MRWMPRGVLAGLSLCLQSCLLDMAPAREPLDRMWIERMLAAEYGSWANGVNLPAVGGDEIRSWPVGAGTTRHGIGIHAGSTLGGGGWSFTGGMVGRVAMGSATVELFGKDVARVHGPKGTANLPDQSYEFFGNTANRAWCCASCKAVALLLGGVGADGGTGGGRETQAAVRGCRA